MKAIGIFGGTFDPVHFGHLRLSVELIQLLDLQEMRLVPNRQQPLKTTSFATAEQRVAMLQLATKDEKKIIIDQRELQMPSPSYTINMLKSLRQEFPQHSLCLMMGIDKLIELPQWQQWQQLIDYAHFVVIKHRELPLPATGPLAELLKQRQTINSLDLQLKPAGHIYFQPVTHFGYSATFIREQLQAGLSVRYLLPDSVLEYIEKNKIYTART